jgi:hypothetical protein
MDPSLKHGAGNTSNNKFLTGPVKPVVTKRRFSRGMGVKKRFLPVVTTGIAL